MTFNNLILLGSVTSFLTYFLSKLSYKIGTVIKTLFIIISMYIIYGNFNTPSSISINEINLNFNVNAFNIYFLVLASFVFLMTSLFSINGIKKYKYKNSYIFLNLLLFTGIIGLFGSSDLITLFIFWELITWVSFFLISLKSSLSRNAALVYIFMSMIGTYFLISGIFIIQNSIGGVSFNLIQKNIGLINTASANKVIIFFVIAAFVKGGVYPLHTWLRNAHGEAPDNFSPVLSGLLTKIGLYLIYFLVIFFPFTKLISLNIASFPFGIIFSYIGGISIIVGTISAILQNDAKKLIAFSTVSHAGYIVLAFSYGTNLAFFGSLMHILVHAFTSLGMFLSIAAVKYRTNTSKMDDLGGLITNMPVTFTTYLVSIISLAGIPPLVGFVSKWMIYQALIVNGSYFLAFAAFFGSIGSFMYVFRPLATVFLGQRPKKYEKIKEVPFLMQLPMLIITLLTVLLGVLPGIIIKPLNKLMTHLGIDPIESSLYKLVTKLTTLDMVLIFTVFGLGFLIALIVFLIFAKTTKVKQHEQYTAGEIVPELKTMPSMYHYSKNYYKPFSRIFSIFPSLESIYNRIAYFAKKIFDIFDNFFYKETVNGYVWIISLVFLTLIIIRWL